MTIAALPQVEPMEQRTEHPYVVQIAGVPTVRGTRLPVRLIAQMHRAGDAVDDILHSYPHLSAAAAHDAISYYLDHRAEMEQEIAAHRLEAVLPRLGGQIDERGFIHFSASAENG